MNDVLIGAVRSRTKDTDPSEDPDDPERDRQDLDDPEPEEDDIDDNMEESQDDD